MFNNKDGSSSPLGFSSFLLCVLEFFRVDGVKGHFIKSLLRERFLQKNSSGMLWGCVCVSKMTKKWVQF